MTFHRWNGEQWNVTSKLTRETAAHQRQLVSFWELIGANRDDKLRSMLELEAISSMQSPRTLLENQTRDEDRVKKVIKVDLTGESTKVRDISPEVSVVTPKEAKRVGHRSRKNEHQLTEQLNAENGPLALTKLFDKSLPAELLTEDT